MEKTCLRTMIGLLLLLLSNISNALTLQQAWSQIRNNNPGIASSEASIHAAQGQLWQAGLLPNPTFNTVQGNIPGFGKYSDNPNSQSSYVVSQLIETGGKRHARQEVASAQLQESYVAHQVNTAELFGLTTQSFLSVAEAQIKLSLSQRAVNLNQQTINTINHRINAGRASLLDLKAAQIASSNQKLQFSSIKSELISGRFTLAKLWNGSENEVNNIVVPSLKSLPLNSLSYYLNRINNNWELQTLCQALKTAKAEMRLADAKKYPDVTVGVGLEHYNQSSYPKSQNAIIAELGVPIPIFDRNQGNYASATANYRKALEDLRNKELTLQSNIAKTYQIAVQAQMQLDTLSKSILPQSQRTLALAQEGYEQGRYSYLDLLNAQQKLIDSKLQEVSARFLYYRAWYVLQISIGKLPQKDFS